MNFIVRRILYSILTLWLLSIVSFVIIQLPPGDYSDTLIETLMQQGGDINQDYIEAIRVTYGLDQPMILRYFTWFFNLFKGNWGHSFATAKPVTKLILERLPLSIAIDLVLFAFVWIVSIPIGIISAVKQYSFGDYAATVIGFIGLAVPNFLLALIILWIGFSKFGVILAGLNSNEYLGEPFSFGKFIDMTKHLWVIIVVAGTGQMAGMIRILRANLLDELNRPYVETARVKGVPEFRLLLKYPVRMAFNPIISSVGYLLPALISSSTITAIVLSIPTVAPLLYDSLLRQDVFVAGGIIMLLSILTVVGTLISDILLYFVDPRVRFSSVRVGE